MNPLLDFSNLPRFAEIKPEHVTPALNDLLTQCRAVVERAADAEPTWEGFVVPMEDANEKLSRAWGQVAHLNAVMNNAELRVVYNENLPKITQYHSELTQNETLFAKYKALKESPGFERLNRARQKIVENELRDFRLGGAELAAPEKARFMEIQEELARLSAKFEENLLDATNAFSVLIVDRGELSGIPDDVMEAAASAAREEQKNGKNGVRHQ